ncbi:hypothetical protein CTAYLR_007984 [Chrysophaeum taylorii]|uniref:DNA mismatch repair proteins mutS family domain-containing protein n=1 Tax=Chrysophaeum taylorii TaxID=2483200 RepID=A0AAD7XKE3_9STRA|nr:hypothetical protein CTAYLR_007984 [Chrysophaeum taylorii]
MRVVVIIPAVGGVVAAAASAASDVSRASFRALGGHELLGAGVARCGSKAGAKVLLNERARSAEEAQEMYETVAWYGARGAERMKGRDARLDLPKRRDDAAWLCAAANAADALSEMRSFFFGKKGSSSSSSSVLLPAFEVGLEEVRGAFERTRDGVRTDRLSDAAFPALREARRRAERAELELGEEAARHDDAFELEKDVHVVPRRRRREGVVRGRSRSGKTLYVEPREVRNVAEALERARADRDELERAAVRRLAATVDEIALRRSLEKAARVDAMVARCVLGADIRGVIPTVGSDGIVDAVGARHPLIENAIPCDARASPDRACIVCGPNGGGKSTLLSLIGLLAFCVRRAIPVPADRGARCDYFDDVLGDVDGSAKRAFGGSTFEAHCRFAAHVIEHQTTRRLLVLMDELGSGTDAAEGGALARATLEALDEATVVAATHDPRLKTLAGDYDIWTFTLDDRGKPTFAARRGVPPDGGRAIEAARRCGLPTSVLERATNLLENEDDHHDSPSSPLLVRLEEEVRDLRNQLRDERDSGATAIEAAASAAARRAEAAAARIVDREAKLDQLYRDLKARPKLQPISIVGESIKAARVATRQSLADRREALLATHGLEPLETLPNKGDSVVLVAFDDNAAALTTSAAVVLDTPHTSTTRSLLKVVVAIGPGAELKVPIDDLATWAVPVLADGTWISTGDAPAWDDDNRYPRRR